MAAEQALERRARPVRSHRSFRTVRAAPAAPRRRPAAAPVARATPVIPRPAAGKNVVLDVQNLKTYFFTYDGVVRAIDGINLQARAGETTGVVGETGCGKSVTAFSVARLIAEPGQVVSGRVLLGGANLLWGLESEASFRRVRNSNRVRVLRRFRRVRATNERMSAVRGKGVAMIFQEPSQAMNPVFSISDQLGEALLLHEGVEVMETLLRAAALAAGAGPTVRTGATDVSGSPVEAGPFGAEAELDALIKAAVVNDREEMRRLAADLAAKVRLPSLATELFYILRDAGTEAPNRRRQLERALERSYLTNMQRAYLRHRRRMALLERGLKEVYLQEMTRERSMTGARSRIRLRMLAERARTVHYRVWGVKRVLERPLRNEIFWRSVRLLEGVRIANPVQVARGFPHELSGGMLQRTMIAMALSSEPQLLLADEPTTALDVTIQAQILELMRELRERVGTAIVLITHDLGVVAEVCDRVNVMYAGLVVESGEVKEIFRRPLHPYTQGLLASIPRFDRPDKQLDSIPGSVPNLIHPPPGCRFHPRCPYAMPVCKEKRPEPTLLGPEHMVACHLYNEPITSTETTGSAATPSAAPPPVPTPPLA